MKLIKNILFTVLLAITLHVSGQPFRYANTVFDAIDTIKNVEFASAPWLNNSIALFEPYSVHDGESKTETRPLLMDIFMPKNDTLPKRPAIIFLHGGAFLLGTRHNDDMVAFCDSFARRGYVTATIDYRIGMGANVTRFLGVPVSISISKSSSKRALYRATQDSRAAIRFLKHNSDIYGIDTTQIFMVGSSAGGLVCLNHLYLDSHEITNDVLKEPSPGALDDIGVSGYHAEPNAIVSLWGAIETPALVETNQTPVFLVHGKEDNIVPFKKGIPLDGIIPPNPIVSFKISEAYGSYCIDTALANRNIFHETYFKENKGHEFYGVDTGEFPPDGPNQYWDTIHCRISNFFFDRFRPEADFDAEVQDDMISFTNIPTINYSVLWDFGDGTTSSELQPVHAYEYELKGNYKISLTVCNELLACDTISQTINISATHVAENVSEKIHIFPNPVFDQIKVRGISVPFNIKIYDLTGNVQLVSKHISNNVIDVTFLNPGIYILKIKTDDTSIIKKFVKTN